ncbi:MAG: NADP-dependent malic enzyme [Ichthyobacteriaceae bacterium]|nr:NADP-dependent malic enzyme [Ichthyobacteriaceae bacterium]
MGTLREDALAYHSSGRKGKIEVVPTKRHSSQRDLALAYSPGVAEPCMEIYHHPETVNEYTAKGNLVAVISNGTAVLGLGDIGPEASKPVMEGKGLLFKIFADIDVFDIEVDTKDIDAFIETVKNIAPTFGGINLEDIKAPEAFEIERRLKEELDIPVMHDDQHGTAIISAAALINACELIEKNIEDVKIVISGAGAAAVSCTRLYKRLGASASNIVMTDSKGIIRKDRSNLTEQKAEFATDRDINTLEEAMVDADVFIGLSKGNVVTPEMLKTMAKDPIVFAMANPTPEIDYKLAVDTRDDIIMGTGRSDTPNQVNNVLGFPFIFRGALDCGAKKITENMKVAAVHALADLAKTPVPEKVASIYNLENIQFGREYIIPKPFDQRLITSVPPAIAKAAMDEGVATKPIKDWDKYKDELMDRMGWEHKVVRGINSRARTNPKRVVYSDGDQVDVIKAAQQVQEDGTAIPILLGNKQAIEGIIEALGLDFNPEIYSPGDCDIDNKLEKFAHQIWEQRKRKGVTLEEARRLIRVRDYFAALMVKNGEADAMISGYSRSYPNVLRPVLEIIGTDDGVDKVAAANLILTKNGPLFFADSSINNNPSAEEISNIAKMTADLASQFGFKPRVALLSHSNFGSSKQPNAKKMSEALAILKSKHADLVVDGEIQSDFALNTKMTKEKFPFSPFAEESANVLVFPNLDSANISFKLVKEIASNAVNIGPILMGMKKSVHILQLHSSVEEIVHMTSVAVVDAQRR